MTDICWDKSRAFANEILRRWPATADVTLLLLLFVTVIDVDAFVSQGDVKDRIR